MEEWNAGILGLRTEINYLNCKKLLQTHHSIIPLFQLGQSPNVPLTDGNRWQRLLFFFPTITIAAVYKLHFLFCLKNLVF